MRIIAKSTLKYFWDKHNDCEQQLLSWYKTIKRAKYESFDDLKLEFGNIKIVGSDRIIFKIKGNKYRLTVKISFANQIVFIRFVGTHQEYDKVDAKQI